MDSPWCPLRRCSTDLGVTVAFEFEETHYKLKFADGALEGLEVVCGDLSAGELASMMRLASGLEDLDNVDALTPDLAVKFSDGLDQLFKVIGDGIISWNVERRGVALPPDEEGVRQVPFNRALGIFHAWLEAAGGVDDPLDVASNGGPPSVAVSLPMAPLSENLLS